MTPTTQGLAIGIALVASAASAQWSVHDPRWFRCENEAILPLLRPSTNLRVRTSFAHPEPSCELRPGDLIDLGLNDGDKMDVAYGWPVRVLLSSTCDDGGRVYWLDPMTARRDFELHMMLAALGNDR